MGCCWLKQQWASWAVPKRRRKQPIELTPGGKAARSPRPPLDCRHKPVRYSNGNSRRRFFAREISPAVLADDCGVLDLFGEVFIGRFPRSSGSAWTDAASLSAQPSNGNGLTPCCCRSCFMRTGPRPRSVRRWTVPAHRANAGRPRAVRGARTTWTSSRPRWSLDSDRFGPRH